MQTTHKIPGSSATTWSRYLVAQSGRGDYYTGEGPDGERAPTRWHGPEPLLRSWGIDPREPAKLEDVRSLMHGFSPASGEPIRPVGSNGTRVAGIDLTYSPPKDVSALWATSSPYRRAQLEAAHRQAVKSALEWTEREVAVVRVKRDGVVSFQPAQRLIAVEAVHTSSRLGRDQDAHGIPDPQLHSHVAVIAAQRPDGRVAAVESKQLFRAAREGGAFYRAELAANLERLGLRIERRTGRDERYFAIDGVSKELAERWSSRGQDVERAAMRFRSRYGREPGPGELDGLTLGTRGSKSAAPELDVNASWRAVGEEYGQTRQRSEQLFRDRDHDRHSERDPVTDATAAKQLAQELIRDLTRQQTMVSERELRARAYELAAGLCRPGQADRIVAGLVRSGELIGLEGRMWTTRRIRQLEQQTVRIAEARAREKVAPVSELALAQARRQAARELKGTLSREQIEALETLTGPGGVTAMVGRAGTGKGVVLGAATKAWRSEGYEVIGTAVAGATAMRLQADAKPDRSLTADSLLHGAQKGHIHFGPGTVVVMDEAAMADHERLAKLVDLTAKHRAKLVLAGDSAQLGAIGPGGLSRELERVVPTAELREVKRARHTWEREAWEHIREGRAEQALASYKAHDRLHIHDTRAQAAQAMVDRWDQARRQLPDGQAIMITDASNAERDQINAMAQERRATAGELGAQRIALEGKPYGLAAGDQVIFTGQYKQAGQQRVENGTLGTILNAHPTPAPAQPNTPANSDTQAKDHAQGRIIVETREPEPRKIELDTGKFSDLSLAYAVHVYKAQGLTAEQAQILTGSWQTDREHTYVAATRAREQTDIFVSREDLGEQGMDTGAIERLADRITRSHAPEASITRPRAQPTAESHNRPRLTTPTKPQRRAQSKSRLRRARVKASRDGEIERVLAEMREQQRNWKRGLDHNRNHDNGLAIE